jgi:hypothetical protein
LDDLSFFTLYNNIIGDYKNLIEQYDPTSATKFKDYHAVHLESTRINCLEFTYMGITGTKSTGNSYENL